MNKNIGQQLKDARLAHQLSLEDVSKATHMRVHYLQALEEGDFEALTSKAQARGFLRAYAQFLELDAASLLAQMDQEPVHGSTSIQEQNEEQTKSIKPATEKEDAKGKGSASAIFVDIGARLREQRETLGLSLEDIEHHTNIRQHYLQALETGDLDSIPSPVQARGMLNNYATFLGMDPDPVLIRFAEGLQARLNDKKSQAGTIRPEVKRRKTVPRPVRRVFSNDLLIGGTLIVFLVLFVLWGGIRIFAMQAEDTPEPTAISIADVLLATSTPSPSPSIEPSDQTPTRSGVILANPTGTLLAGATPELPTPPIGGQEGLEVYISVYNRAWLKVTVDEEVEFEGRALPGSAYTFSGEKQVEILTGNGLAVQVYFNSTDLGRMGEYGQVVLWIFTKKGQITPTPTITATPTVTQRVTSTPRPQPGESTPTPPAP